jgi:dUTP pyrophosphatase
MPEPETNSSSGMSLSGNTGVLGRAELERRIQSERPLVSGWLDLTAQLQPNGFDLTLQEIGRLAGAGTIGIDNANRVLPDLQPIPFDADGYVMLGPGPYQIVYNEIVDLPNDLMALGRPRSSLCRCGVTVHTAVWDAGYRGRSTSLLVVDNPDGFRLQRGARVMQLVFFGLMETVERGYQGIYQGENIAPPTERRTSV